MNISSVNPSIPSSVSGAQQGGNAEAKICALEQKLQTLNAEKQKAIRNKDEEKEKKLEKQIQEIEKQIQQLKQQEKAKKKEDAPAGAGVQDTALKKAAVRLSGAGNSMDVYA